MRTLTKRCSKEALKDPNINQIKDSNKRFDVSRFDEVQNFSFIRHFQTFSIFWFFNKRSLVPFLSMVLFRNCFRFNRLDSCCIHSWYFYEKKKSWESNKEMLFLLRHKYFFSRIFFFNTPRVSQRSYTSIRRKKGKQ